MGAGLWLYRHPLPRRLLARRADRSIRAVFARTADDLRLAGIAGRIRYVVDSAPFKQGKFTPATHLPIVAPDHLKRDPVNAIIVMAAAYSDEVAGIIREKHGPELELAILRDTGLEICR